MAIWKRLCDYQIDLEDRPGELARLTSMMRAADIGIIGIVTHGQRGGDTTITCVPESAEQFQDFLNSSEQKATRGEVFLVMAPDSGGTLIQVMEHVAREGINIKNFHAVVIQGQFGCLVWPEEGSNDTLEQALASL